MIEGNQKERVIKILWLVRSFRSRGRRLKEHKNHHQRRPSVIENRNLFCFSHPEPSLLGSCEKFEYVNLLWDKYGNIINCWSSRSKHGSDASQAWRLWKGKTLSGSCELSILYWMNSINCKKRLIDDWGFDALLAFCGKPWLWWWKYVGLSERTVKYSLCPNVLGLSHVSVLQL